MPQVASRSLATEASDPGLAMAGSRVTGYEAFWKTCEPAGKEGVEAGMGACLCQHHDRTLGARRELFQPFRRGEVSGLAGWNKYGGAAIEIAAC